MKKISDRNAKLLGACFFVFMITGTMFLNCGRDSSQTIPVATNSSNIEGSDASTTPTPSPLSAKITPQEIVIGQTAQVTASGGQAPYTYSLTGSNGTIDPNTGLISGQTGYGGLGVVVTDADGATFSTSLVVSNPSLSTAGQCTFVNMTIPNTGTVTAYSASTVACGSTCQSQVLTCANGQLSGQVNYPYASCSVTACAWKSSATACSNPMGTTLKLPCTKGSTYCYGSTSGYSGGSSGSYGGGTTGALYTCE